jgi:nitrogen fixation NifU-like protein
MDDEPGKGGLEEAVRRIQAAIDEEEARSFSPQVLREARSPSNLRAMEGADGASGLTGGCGDTIRFFVRLERGRIADASFLTDGCGATLACGSMLTRLSRGMTLEEARAFTDDDLLAALGGLPDENRHCARLSVAAMHRAVRSARGPPRARGPGARGASDGPRGRPPREGRRPGKGIRKTGATARASSGRGRRAFKRGARSR